MEEALKKAIEFIKNQAKQAMRNGANRDVVDYYDNFASELKKALNQSLPQGFPNDEAIKAKIKSLGWEVDGTAESNDMIEIAKWMRERMMKEMAGFAEWCGTHYVKCHGGWWPRYAKETTENIVTTQQLIDLWNKSR